MAAVQILDTDLFNDANLQHYYTLEDANDDKGAINLTNNNTVTFATAKFNNGADLGSSAGNKSLSTTNNMGYGGGAYAISFWVKLNTEITSGFYRFVDLVDGGAGTDTSLICDYDYNSGTPRITFGRVRLGTAADTANYSSGALGTTGFHNFIITYNGSNVKLIHNGSNVANVNSSGNGTGTPTTGLAIGVNRSDLTSNDALAIFDDFAMFDRDLLAADWDLIYNGISEETGGGFFLNQFIN